MMSFIALILVAAAMIGAGAMVLRACQVHGEFARWEALTWSFLFGFGGLGWLTFFLAWAGLVTAPALAAVCVALLPGWYFLKAAKPAAGPIALDGWQKILVAAIAVALIYDLLEGLAPPTDADSLAYHFATPKLFLKAGGLYFIPRANDGAIPLLQQMNYLLGLGLGGERTMTLLAMLSGWMVAAICFVMVRRHVGLTWALVLALLVLTTPVFIYAAGTGQVEARNAAFVLAAAFFTAAALRSGKLSYVILAGIAAGFFVGSKYSGLLLAFMCGVVLLGSRRRFTLGAVFSAAVLIVGGQWYFWNWLNTGDPIFPLLYGLVEYLPGVPWNAAQHDVYANSFKVADTGVPKTVLWSVLYPIKATVDPLPEFEAIRAGFGPFALAALPLVLPALWSRRRSLHHSRVFAYAVIGIGFYLLWFFLGPSQLVRHLAPIYPLLAICIIVAAAGSVSAVPALKWPAAGLVVFVAGLQLGAHSLASIGFARFAFDPSADRDTYLDARLGRYQPVKWLNENVPPDGKVFVYYRETIYHFEVPVFYAHAKVQAQVEFRPDTTRLDKFWAQLKAQNISHLLVADRVGVFGEGGELTRLIQGLEAQGCLTPLKRFDGYVIPSQTLSGLPPGKSNSVVLAMAPETCRI